MDCVSRSSAIWRSDFASIFIAIQRMRWRIVSAETVAGIRLSCTSLAWIGVAFSFGYFSLIRYISSIVSLCEYLSLPQIRVRFRCQGVNPAIPVKRDPFPDRFGIIFYSPSIRELHRGRHPPAVGHDGFI